METKRYALQDLGAPDGICFGCGSKNEHGLRIKSYWDDDNLHVIATHILDARTLVGLHSCMAD